MGDVMPPMGLALKQLVPQGGTLTPFEDISDLYYDPVSNYVWVADVEQTTPIIPIINAGTRTTQTVLNIPIWGTGSTLGASGFAADSNNVYASPSVAASVQYIVIISKTTLLPIGYLNPLWSSVSYSVANPGTMVVPGDGFLYMLTFRGSPANVLKFNIAAAIAAFPTPVTPVAANVDTYTGGSLVNAPFTGESMTYDSVTDHLWIGSTYEPPSYSGQYQVLFELDTSLTVISETLFTAAVTPGPATQWISYVFGNVIWSIGGNSVSPYHTFGTDTAQLYSNGLAFATLPTSAPYTNNTFSFRAIGDSIDSTLLVLTFENGSGQSNAIARYNSSGSLVSTLPVPSGTIIADAITATTASDGIWMGYFDETVGPPFFSKIAIYSHSIGSETITATITGF